jgi:TatD DNase family protein
MLIDAHAHLDELDDDELLRQLDAARLAGVTGIVAIGGRPPANGRVAAITARHPGTVYGAIGFDRDQAGAASGVPSGWEADLAAPGIVAVGECGLDYHYHPETRPAQMTLFARMADIAARRGLPIVVHSREAEEDTLAILRECGGRHPDPARRGVLHCFTGSRAFAGRALDLGLHIGVSGIVTFRNAAELAAVAAFLPPDRMVVETDAPYLSPEPLRGRRNEPAHLIHTVRRLAELRNSSVEALAAETASNTRRLFGLPPG